MDIPPQQLPGIKAPELQALPAYQKILESNGLGVLVLDEQGYIRAASPLIAGTLGTEPEVLLTKRIFDIEPHLSLIGWKKIWKTIRKKGLHSWETEHMARGEALLPVRLQAVLIREEEQSYCLASVENLLETGSPENENLTKNESLYLTKFTLDHAREMIFWEKADGSFSYANITAAKKLGYSRTELLKLRAQDIVHGYSNQERNDAWQTLRQEGEAETEITLQAKDGSLIPIYCSMNFIRFKGQEINCIFARDWRRKKQQEERLNFALQKVRELSERLREENSLLKEEININYNFNNIISQSDKYKKILQQVEQVAGTDATVLIVGETGTGKELLARAIHRLSKRDDAPLIKVNCAGLPKDLIESELFGHEKGAFTGAYQQKKGRFELAHKGTIFLDEIGELPLGLQSKLLRVLQEGEFERVGGTRTIRADVRVIAATNRDLEQMADEGQFRQDLFYRLNVFPIRNMPLRERREDIPLLVRHFTEKYSDKAGKPITNIPKAGVGRLMKYEFPGNIRELENIIERAVILSSGNTLNLDDSLPESRRKKREGNNYFQSFEDMQRDHIVKALDRTNWRVTGPKGAARLLKLNGRTLASKMRRLGIRREDFAG